MLFASTDRHGRELAAALRGNKAALCRALFSAVRDKSCATWHIALEFEGLGEWERSQLSTAIDLLIARFETGDPLFLDLFAGCVHSRIATDLSAEGAPSDYKPAKAIELFRASGIDRLKSTLLGEALQLFSAGMDQIAAFLARPAGKTQRILFIGDCLQFELITALLGPCARA